jgi:threonine aldolase
MRQAMSSCAVGDDVMRDDPTILALEQQVAQLVGKQDAVFVPSGTMANLLALMTHCNSRASEFIVGDQAHIYIYEQGGASALAGIHPRVVQNLSDGSVDLDVVKTLVRSKDSHFPRTRVLCLENTHNRMGGKVLGEAYLQKAKKVCEELNIALHIDGARIWNAAAALGVKPVNLAKHCDSISVCLSKGLGAPVGSLLCGTKEFVAEARYLRKGLGGGMRQSGVLAVCGLVALEEELPRIGDDHVHAKILGKGLEHLLATEIESNMVLINVLPEWKISAQEFAERLKAEEEILCFAVSSTRIRLVLHRDISKDMVHEAIVRINSLISKING